MQDACSQYFITFLRFTLVQHYISFLRLWTDLICTDHHLFGRKAGCYCMLVQNLNHSRTLFYLPPQLLQKQINKNKIPHFAPGPVWILHLPLPLLGVLERFIVNFSIKTWEFQHSWNLNVTHWIIHFIWSGKKPTYLVRTAIPIF